MRVEVHAVDLVMGRYVEDGWRAIEMTAISVPTGDYGLAVVPTSNRLFFLNHFSLPHSCLLLSFVDHFSSVFLLISTVLS